MSSKTRTLYVVWGYTGPYEDRRQWPVAAYRDKELAEAHRAKAEKKAELPAANAFDPAIKMDHTGVWYEVEEVELRTKLPEDGHE